MSHEMLGEVRTHGATIGHSTDDIAQQPIPGGHCISSINNGHRTPAEPGNPNHGDGQPDNAISHAAPAEAVTPIIDQIRAHHRKRCFMMEQRKRSNLALGSFLRMALGWRKDLPEDERERIAAEAAGYIKTGEGPFADVIAANELAREPFERIERECLRQMEKLAKSLPCWVTFGEPIRGFGAASLAVIVAEAGDLSSYSTDAKLWKRMGLAVLGGIRQGGLSRSAKAEDWIAHGYSPMRRSRMWNIGDSLIKGNRDGKYRTIYLQRKVHERQRDPEMRLIHAHRRAQRYMEKRLLRDLWRAWRKTKSGMDGNPIAALSSASLSEAAE